MGIRHVFNACFIASFLGFPWPALQLADAAAPGKSASFTPLQKEDFWLSEGGNYTFGFKDVGDAAYLLSIWHSADSNQTAIWWADIAHNPVVKDGASFNHTSRGILQLYNASSILVWSSGDTTSSTLEFQDTGNLRLLKDDNQVAWESFEADGRDSFMLVGLGDGSMLQNRPRLLQSRRNQSSYAVGRFHLATDESLILFLYGLDPSNNDFLYFTGVSMNISEGVIRIGQRYHNITPASDRLALDYDGNLRVYSWQSNGSSWQVVWELIHSTKCRVGSPCGPFGICSWDGSPGDAVSCTCPPGYHARVPGDNTQGCTGNTSFNASCGLQNSGYNTTILEVPNTDYYYNDMVIDGVNADLEQCKTMCLKNCTCLAATYFTSTSGGKCYLKGNSTRGYLMNGYSTDSAHTLLIKVGSPIEVLDDRKGGAKWLIGVGVAAGVVMVGVIVGCACLLWQRRGGARSRWTRAEITLTDVVSGAGPVRFTYQELVEATEKFRDPLGKGGFGVVYKGRVRGKRVAGNQQAPVEVAVKVLNESASEGEKQFRAEVNTLGKIHHVNLVNLLGYCATDRGRAGEKWMLVYEYMENGSLDRFLSAARMEQPLPWPIRYSIALGTARGIAYLHHECHPKILHCDIKPQNVLLDQDFTAKVADFGLAKRFLQRESHLTLSNHCGTRGFMAPELLKRGFQITPKADVYSFGMLLLELVNGLNTGNDHMLLIEWAVRCISAEVLLPLQASYSSAAAVVAHLNDDGRRGHTTHSSPSQQDDHSDGNLSRVNAINSSNTGQEDNRQEEMEKLRVLKVALWCVQPTPSERPFMSRVVQLIEAVVAVENPPNPTLFPSLLNCDPSTISNNSLSVSNLSAR